MAVPSNLEIAQAHTLEPIAGLAARYGLLEDEVDPYGRYKAKVDLSIIERLKDRPDAENPFHGLEALAVQAGVVEVIVAAVDAEFAAGIEDQPGDGADFGGVEVVPGQSAGASDGVFFRGAGIPTYGVSEIFMKDSDDFAHGLNERLPVKSFYDGLQYWQLLIRELAGGKRGPAR